MFENVFKKLATLFGYGLPIPEEDEIVKEYHRFAEGQTTYKDLTGVITQIASNCAEIDDKYVFPLATDIFSTGDEVSFRIFRKGHGIEISNVRLITPKAESEVRSVSCFITNIEGTSVSVTPGEYSFDTNLVEIDFKPEVGDYLTLEGTFPKRGDYSVSKVRASENKMISGTITNFNEDQNCGEVAGDVYFSLNVCFGFTPAKNFSVFGTAIKVKNEKYIWRAVTLTLLSRNINSKIEIARIPFFTLGLGERKTVDIQVNNLSGNVIEVNEAEIAASDPDIKFVNQPNVNVLGPGAFVTYSVECLGKKLGKTSANLKWTFGRVIIRRTLKYDTVVSRKVKMEGRTETLIFPAKSKFTIPNFVNVRLKNYAVPQELENIENGSLITMMGEAKRIFPSLGNQLSKLNYGDIMHSLLFLEERKNVDFMKTLTNNFCFYRRQDFLMICFEAESPYSRLSPGDTVLVRKPWEENVKFQGKIWEMTSNTIFLKFHPQFMNDYKEGALYNVEFLLNRTPMRKRHFAIDAVIRNQLLDRIFPTLLPLVENISNKALDFWFNENLNREQQVAVQSILQQENKIYPYIICGPPGTGKTITLVELILQLCRIPETKLIIAAPTNSAIDLICMKLLEAGINKAEIIRLASYSCMKNGQIPANLMDVSFVPSLFEDLPNMYSESIPVCTKNSIGIHKITLSTLNCIGTVCAVGLPPGFFTHVIIDEAGQSTEPESLIPITFLDKSKSQLVFAGDPLQLGPVIISRTASQYGFDISLLARLANSATYIKKKDIFKDNLGYDNRLITRLVKNYRALPKLVKMISDIFYDGELIPSITSEDSRESEILKSIEIDGCNLGILQKSIIFVQVDGEEEQVEENWSWFNTAEVLKVVLLLNQLYKSVTPDQVGVITPYSLQARKINDSLEELKMFAPKIGSVEEFQGAEKDVIIYSLVRNANYHRTLPDFLNNPHKVNVALSRARILNIIVGSKTYICRDQLWSKILKYCQ